MKRRAKSNEACKDTKMEEKLAKDETRHPPSSNKLRNLSHSSGGNGGNVKGRRHGAFFPPAY
jgi:hypothetical protein